MVHTPYTLMLDDQWDITLNSVGGIATSLNAYSTAQNVGNECRLFTDDAYFAQDQGIPHFVLELGQRAPESLLRAYLRTSALRVPQVAEVTDVMLDSFDPETRTLRGSIQFTTEDGDNVRINI